MTARRAFFQATACALLLLPMHVEAQPAGNVPRIGFLGQNSPETVPATIRALREELRRHGWVDGQNVHVEVRYAEGKVERAPALVAELIGLNVDVIVTSSSATTRAAKSATKSIPIVMAASVDAVGEGIVASLAHPGENVTGMTFQSGPEIAGKQLQLLTELVPRATHVAVLTNPTNRSHAAFLRELKVLAKSRGLELQVLAVSSADRLESAFAAMTQDRATALLVLTDSLFVGQHRRIADLAAASKLPALYSQKEFVVAGGLASYGPSLTDMFRRAAIFVDKILRGERPGDIPVEQPAKFELVVNLKTAKALGLTVPAALVVSADELIQ